MRKRRAVLCPFHDEKVPSLVIDEIQMRGYCFGCQKEYKVHEIIEQYEKRWGAEKDRDSDFITNEQGEPEMLINPSKEEFLQQLSGSIYQVDEKRDNITIPYRIFQKMLEFLREDC